MSKTRIIVIALLGVLIGSFLVMVAVEKRRVESLNCYSAVRSICWAARVWAEDQDELMPTNLVFMSNVVSSPKILWCQPARCAPCSNWSAFRPENSNYEIVTPGARADETNKVFIRCTIHGHLGYCDGRVVDGARRGNALQ
jgi:hypothetical protein